VIIAVRIDSFFILFTFAEFSISAHISQKECHLKMALIVKKRRIFKRNVY